MDMKRATVRLEREGGPEKAEAAERQIRGYASTWDLDLGGDVIERGAFSVWLQEWRGGGAPLPLLDTHQGFGMDRVLGKLVSAEETDRGLWTVFDMAPTPEGERALQLVRGGFVDGLSIGYVIHGRRQPTSAEQLAGVDRVLTNIALREISLVLWPMNESARSACGETDRDHEASAEEHARLKRRLRAVIDADRRREREDRDRTERLKARLDRLLGPVRKDEAQSYLERFGGM